MKSYRFVEDEKTVLFLPVISFSLFSGYDVILDAGLIPHLLGAHQSLENLFSLHHKVISYRYIESDREVVDIICANRIQLIRLHWRGVTPVQP